MESCVGSQVSWKEPLTMDQIYRVNTTGEYLAEYREKVAIIRRHNPAAEIPPETDGINALRTVREMVRKIENPTEPGLTPADRLRHEVNALQTQVSNELADAARRGIVEQKDFEFPDEDLPILVRKSKLIAMRSGIFAAKEKHAMPAEIRVKVLEREFQTFKLEIAARIGALEQERANESLRD